VRVRDEARKVSESMEIALEVQVRMTASEASNLDFSTERLYCCEAVCRIYPESDSRMIEEHSTSLSAGEMTAG
jgi:hypothetical protein